MRWPVAACFETHVHEQSRLSAYRLGVLQSLLGGVTLAASATRRPCACNVSNDADAVCTHAAATGIHLFECAGMVQVRSLTLDVRVWDDGPLMQLMEGLGNAAGNEAWEETLRHINARADSWVWCDTPAAAGL